MFCFKRNVELFAASTTIIYSKHEKWKSFFVWRTETARKRGFVSLKHGGDGTRGRRRERERESKAQLNILCMKNQLHYHIWNSKFYPFKYTKKTLLLCYTYIAWIYCNNWGKFVFMENWATILTTNGKF